MYVMEVIVTFLSLPLPLSECISLLLPECIPLSMATVSCRQGVSKELV